MYTLTQFKTTMLPVAAAVHTAGTAPSQQRMVQTLGAGIYDAFGTARADAELPFELVYNCKVVGTAAELRTALDELRALKGVEDKLYRRVVGDTTTRQWATARLMRVDYDTEVKHSHGRFQPVMLTFLVKTIWRGVLHGPAWYLDSGEYLDDGLYLNMGDRYALTTTPKTLTITNGGNVAQDHVKLTLEAGATPVTGLSVVCGSCHLVWSGTVAASTELVINCAPTRRSVLNNGVAAWNYLDLGGGHASDAWMRLAVGANSMVVTRTGGGSDTYLTVTFSDAWE